MIRRSSKLLSSLALASVILAATPAYGQEAYWNFNGVDIRTLIQQVSNETGKNFIVDPRVQGVVTVISNEPLSQSEAYEVFLSILSVHGYSAIETGSAVKIVPIDRAPESGVPVITKKLQSDNVVIKVVELKYVSSPNVQKSLLKLVPKTSFIASIDETNHIVIADTAANIQSLEKIIEEIDKPEVMKVDIVPIFHASATDLTDTLNNLVQGKKIARSTSKPIEITADERTNSLLIAGGTPDSRAYVADLIRQLDEPTNNQHNSEVIYLKYAQARNMAPIVATFLEEAMQSAQQASLRQLAQAGPMQRAAVGGGQLQDTQSRAPTNHLRALKSSDEDYRAQGSLFGMNENQPQSGVVNQYVQWDESTNSLIVKAPPNLMRAVKGIIDKLDIRRPQVLIEVIIAEINVDRATELGVEWNTSPSAQIDFGTRFLGDDGITGGFDPGSIAQLGTGISVGIFRHGNLRVLAKALASDVASNILSTPSLVTLDNQVALIKVGELVPFAIGQTNNADAGGQPFTSFDREEVGLSLTIKPQITSSGAIKLEIENILSNVIPGTAAQNAGNNPRTAERTIVTNVMIDNGKVLVLGGLIQDSWQEQVSEVPLVGKIPVIGELFKSTDKQLVKRNLMVFIKPIILRDEVEGIEVSNKRYENMRMHQRRSYSSLDHPLVDEAIIMDPLKKEDFYASNQKVYREEDMYPGLILPPPFSD